MSNVGYATLTIIPSAKGFGKALDKDTKAPLKSSGDAGGKAMGGSIVSSLKGLIGPAMALVGAGAMAAFVKGTIEEASGLTESLNAIKVTYGDAADAVLVMGENAAKGLGLSNLEFNNLAVQFSAAAKGIAGEGGDVSGTLKDLTGRAADFASVMNLDVADAAALFQSGLAGETEPLRRYGIDLSAASVATYAYANGIAAAGEELTQQQKQQAAYGLLMQQTAYAQGDFANTSGQLANQQRILGATWDNIRASLGTGLLPIMGLLYGAMNMLMEPLAGLAAGFSTWASGATPAIESILGVMNAAGGGLDGLAAGLSAIGSSLVEWLAGGGLVSAIEQGAAVRDSLIRMIGEALPGIVQALASAAPAILGAALQAFGSLVTALVETVPMLVTTLLGALPSILEALLGMIPGLLASALVVFQSIVQAIVLAVPLIVTTLVGILPTLVTTIMSMLPSIITAALDLFLGLVQGLITAIPVLITSLLGALPTILTTLLGMLPDLVLGAVDLFMGLVTGLLEMLPDLIETLIGDVLPTLITTLIGMVPDLIVGAVTLFTALVTGLLDNLPSLLDTIIFDVIPAVVNALIEAVPLLIDAGIDLIGGLIEGLGQAAGDLYDFMLQVIDDAVDGVLEFLGIHSPSRLFREIGLNTGKGMALGLRDSAGLIADASDALIPVIPSASSSYALGLDGAPDTGGNTFVDFDYTQIGGEGLTSEQELRKAGSHLKKSIR